jgi:Lectin C-type domain
MSGKIRQRISSAVALWLSAAGCADVLGLPDHPRLVEDMAASPRGQRLPTPNNELESSDAGPEAVADAGVRPGTGEGAAATPPLQGSIQRPSRTPSTGIREMATPDAGTSAGPTASPDALAPPLVCAASTVLGPDGNCYATLTTPLNWLEARQGCRALGAGWQLASIRSAQINQFLSELVAGESWIGATDMDAEGTWIWIDDGTVFWNGDDTGNRVNGGFVNWGGTEPNGEDGSNCARMVPDNSGVWADFECEELLSAVCAGPPG